MHKSGMEEHCVQLIKARNVSKLVVVPACLTPVFKQRLLSLPVKTQDIWSIFTSILVFACTCDSAESVLQDCRPQVRKGSEAWLIS
jgi:hypothetical protein